MRDGVLARTAVSREPRGCSVPLAAPPGRPGWVLALGEGCLAAKGNPQLWGLLSSGATRAQGALHSSTLHTHLALRRREHVPHVLIARL